MSMIHHISLMKENIVLTKQTLLIFGRHSCRVTQVFDAKFVTDGLELKYFFPTFFHQFSLYRLPPQIFSNIALLLGFLTNCNHIIWLFKCQLILAVWLKSWPALVWRMMLQCDHLYSCSHSTILHWRIFSGPRRVYRVHSAAQYSSTVPLHKVIFFSLPQYNCISTFSSVVQNVLQQGPPK